MEAVNDLKTSKTKQNKKTKMETKQEMNLECQTKTSDVSLTNKIQEREKISSVIEDKVEKMDT